MDPQSPSSRRSAGKDEPEVEDVIRDLARFRYALRKFLRFSENGARQSEFSDATRCCHALGPKYNVGENGECWTPGDLVRYSDPVIPLVLWPLAIVARWSIGRSGERQVIHGDESARRSSTSCNQTVALIFTFPLRRIVGPQMAKPVPLVPSSSRQITSDEAVARSPGSIHRILPGVRPDPKSVGARGCIG
jgi:hypothetical protein